MFIGIPFEIAGSKPINCIFWIADIAASSHPQYGGYCAYGWAQGYAVKIEPDAWAIEGGKLYLNYSRGVQKDWDKDRAGYIKKADTNYVRNMKK